jgi:hypothetical protein
VESNARSCPVIHLIYFSLAMAPKRGTKRSSNGKDAPSKVQKTKSTSKEESKDDIKRGKPEDIVKKLLSDDIGKLAFPDIQLGHGEIDWPAGTARKEPPSADAGKTNEDDKGKLRNYATPDLTPFEQLICAILLSKPISHKLGLRSIQTLLSPPYSFTTPRAMADAGSEGRRGALWEARTQHKEKTATQLGDLVDGLRKITGSDDEEAAIQLSAVQKEAAKASSHKEAVEATTSLLTKEIKGLGPTGVSIFLRQVQKHPDWKCVFPFIDDRGLKLATHYGLVEDGKDAEEGAKQIAKLVEQDPKKFVKLLDVLIGIDLEKKTEEVLKEISA